MNTMSRLPRRSLTPKRSASITEALGLLFVTQDPKKVNVHSIEISAEALEALLDETLSLYMEDEGKDYARLQKHVNQLAEHTRSQDHKLCNFSQQQNCEYCCSSRLNEIISDLIELIHSTPSLPATVTAAIHSKIGLLRMKLGDFGTAIESLLKALWIQSSLPASAVDPVEKTDLLWKVAMTKHRLGLAYGRSGNFEEAARLLQNAVDDYQQIGPELGHQKKMAEQAQEALENTLEAKILNQAIRLKGSSPSIVTRRSFKGPSVTTGHGTQAANQGRSRSPLAGSKI